MAGNVTTRVELRALAIAALKAAGTLAGQNVRAASVLPMMTASLKDFPALFATVPSERKASLGNAGPPKFTTSMDLTIVARAAANVINTDDATALADIDTLVEQVENAILGSYDMLLVIQEFAAVETHVVLASTGGTAIGEATIRFQCELFQTYQPPLGEPLTLIDATLETPAGQHLAEAAISLPQS